MMMHALKRIIFCHTFFLILFYFWGIKNRFCYTDKRVYPYIINISCADIFAPWICELTIEEHISIHYNVCAFGSLEWFFFVFTFNWNASNAYEYVYVNHVRILLLLLIDGENVKWKGNNKNRLVRFYSQFIQSWPWCVHIYIFFLFFILFR